MRLPDISVFSHTAFARFWIARAFLVLGAQIMATALGWHIYELARTRGDSVAEASFLLGVVGLVQFLPLLALSLIGGQAADRLNRKYILMATMAMKGLCALILIGVSSLTPDLGILLILSIGAVIGATNAFAPAAASALMPSLVPREVLPTAIAWSSLSFTMSSVAGPGVGGLLLGFVGPEFTYATAAALMFSGCALLSFVAAPKHVAQAGAKALDMIREGLAYVRGNKIVLGAISLDLVVVFLAGAQALLPVFARDVLEVGPQGLGLLRGAVAAGAAVMGLVLAAYPLQRRVGRWMFGATIIFGLCTIVFGISEAFWLTWAALFIAGAADMISVYVRSSLIQLATPDAMRGRVSSVSYVFISASNELGDFEAGLMARLFGPGLSVVIGGALATCASVLWMRLFPDLAKADTFEDPVIEKSRGPAETTAERPAVN